MTPKAEDQELGQKAAESDSPKVRWLNKPQHHDYRSGFLPLT